MIKYDLLNKCQEVFLYFCFPKVSLTFLKTTQMNMENFIADGKDTMTNYTSWA